MNLINLILQIFGKKLVKIKYIDEIDIDSVSPICIAKVIQCGMTQIVYNQFQSYISGIVKKQHFKWELQDIKGDSK